MPSTWLKLSFFLLIPFLLGGSVQAQTSSEKGSVALTASVQKSPARITLSWTTLPSTSNITVYRKLVGASSWGTAIASPAASASQYADNAVTVGVAYEYRVVRVAGGVTGQGYLSSGIDIQLNAYKGKIVLLVDNTFTSSLSSELAQLTKDLRADGWAVLRSDVSRSASVVSVRNTVIGHYNSDPANVKAVYIIGHVPVPYSGNINPDGHNEHRGAWPCDGYYGEMNGTWTDNSVNNNASQRAANSNIPGDGKFDQSTFPSTVELQVGRVDMFDMPAFAQSETELLRAYLVKAHNYKMKLWTPQQRGLIYDNLQWVANPLAASAFRNITPMVGAANTSAPNIYMGDFNTLVNGQSYLWTYASGGGLQATEGGVLTFNGGDRLGTTQGYAAMSGGGVFNMSFGSYFGDWDNKNNFLKAPIAGGSGLTSVWAGIPAWYFHHMGMGENIGLSTWYSMNNTSTQYTPLTDGWQGSMGTTHLGLMGDPSLRQKMVVPPSNLQVTNASGTAAFTWTASPEAVDGYHLFRFNSNGSIVKLTTAPITGTSYSNITVPFTAGAEYMVRSVKLEAGASGSYFNMSLGVIATASGTASSTDCLGVVGGSALPGTACNDGDPCTTNDKWNANCQCVGTNVTPVAVITPAGSVSFCAGGSVVLNATTGSGYTYLWKRNGTNISGATGSSYTATLDGSYTVSISAGSCAVISSAQTVHVGALPVATLTAGGPTTFCPGGSVPLNASTGSGYTYQWRRNGQSISGASASSYSATQAGTYSATIVSAGCVANTPNIVVAVSSAPTATVTAGGPTSFCTGGSVTLSTPAVSGSSYVWKRGGTTISGATANSYSANLAGSYTVTVSSTGCTSTSSAITVSVSAPPAATLTAAGSTTFCTGGSVVLNANTGTGLSYVWDRGGTAISGATASSYTATQAGSYRVTVSSAGCTATSSALTVSVSASAAATLSAAGPTSFCTGGSVVLNANTGAGLSYVWKRGGTTISGATGSSYTANQAGSYTVTVSSTGCTSTSSVVTVSVSAPPAATITAAGTTSFCEGGSVVLNANTGTGLSYVWKRGGTTISGATASSYTASQAGSYTVTVSSAGCTATSSAATVSFSSSAVATLSAAGPTSFCQGGSVVLNANTGPGLSYVWKRGGTTISGATASSYTANQAGSYTVTVSSTGCTATSSAIAVSISAPPVATVTAASTNAFCMGGSVVLNASTGTGYTYIWKRDGVIIPGASGSSYTVTLEGFYTVTVSVGGCTAVSAAQRVHVGPLPVATLTAAGPTTFCPGGSVTLNASTGPGYTYQWRRNAVTITGASGSSYTATQAGTYSAIVISAGCVAITPDVVVAINSASSASLTANGPTSLCIGGSVTLSTTAVTGATYVWKRGGTTISGATANSYSANQAGSYTVTVSSAGCTATSSALTVSVSGTQTATLTAVGATTFCAGGSVLLNANTGSGLSYVWKRGGTTISGATSSSYTASIAGSYTVVVSSGTCSATSSAIAVSINAQPVVSCSSNAGNGTVTALLSGGVAPYTIVWNTSPVQTTATATVSISGSYTVTVTDASGCRTTCTTTITLAQGSSCGGTRTESQSTWAATASGSNPAAYMASNFASAFPGGNYLTIGCGWRKLRLTSASAVSDFLPSTGSASQLPWWTMQNPGSSYGNSFAGELVALKLSVRFDELAPGFNPSPVLLKDMVIASGTFAGWTVDQLISSADAKIGGCSSSYSRGDLHTAVAAVNAGYLGGSMDSGYLTCPGPGRMTMPMVSEGLPILEEEQMVVSVFPNPATDVATLVINGIAQNSTTTVSFYSLSGVQVSDMKVAEGEKGVEQRVALDVSDLAPGIYFYKVVSGDRSAAGRIAVE